MSYVLMAGSFPKARKVHRCIWCGGAILKGEKYRNEESIYDNSWQHHKWHMECDTYAQKEHFGYGEEEFVQHENERPIKEDSE